MEEIAELKDTNSWEIDGDIQTGRGDSQTNRGDGYRQIVGKYQAVLVSACGEGSLELLKNLKLATKGWVVNGREPGAGKR